MSRRAQMNKVIETHFERYAMNKRFLMASIVACNDVFYNATLAEGVDVTLKGNKRDLLKKIKSSPEDATFNAKVDDKGDLYIN